MTELHTPLTDRDQARVNQTIAEFHGFRWNTRESEGGLLHPDGTLEKHQLGERVRIPNYLKSLESMHAVETHLLKSYPVEAHLYYDQCLDNHSAFIWHANAEGRALAMYELITDLIKVKGWVAL